MFTKYMSQFKKADAAADVCEYFIPPSQQHVVTDIMRFLPRRREAPLFARCILEYVQVKGRRAFLMEGNE